MSDNLRQIGVGIIGCGNISDFYIRAIKKYPQLQLIGVTDIDPAKALQKSQLYNVEFFPTLDDFLEDARIEIAVVLTIHHTHFEISKLCLEAGRNVYCEKPLALHTSEVLDLIAISKKVNKRLASAPINFLGEAQQTAWKHINSGRLGNVRVAYAEVNWGRIETWHPNPLPFYEVGPLWDVGIYPITLLTAIFGPIKTVRASKHILLPDRKTLDGIDFSISTPDFYLAFLEFADGLIARLTASFYVERLVKFTGLEVFGDKASLYLSSWHDFNARIEMKPFGREYELVPLIREPIHLERNVDWARGVVDLANAIRINQPHRTNVEHALHVVEVIEKITSLPLDGNQIIEISSTFPSPALLDLEQQVSMIQQG